ncbi:MAG: MlaE family lipid ABC transporter permease subunit [Desulfobacterales bacterium]
MIAANGEHRSGTEMREKSRYIFPERVDFDHIQSIWAEVDRFLSTHPGNRIVLDFVQVEAFDSSGIALLRMIRRYCRERGMEMDLNSAPARVRNFFRYVEMESAFPETPPTRKPNPVSQLGKMVEREAERTLGLFSFIKNMADTCFEIVKGQGRMRWKETMYYLQSSGYEALPIVFLLSFLIGLVLAFQAAVQLRQFGANIYVADLVSISVFRELGPVFTAVILAGRSGSAYAAEIGTMKVNEEVDAITVMGIGVQEFLVLPKVAALALAGPLLTIFGNASAVIGGVVVGMTSLDLTAAAFLNEVRLALTMGDVLTGLLKSFVFAVLVSSIGCFRGLQTGKGAQSVGRQTTSAVVSGIFLIIAADAVFTALFYGLSW